MQVSARTLTAIGLAVLILLGAGRHVSERDSSARVERALRHVEELYGSGEVFSHAALQHPFLALIDERDGPAAIRALDVGHAGIAFDEAQRTVYFLHWRETHDPSRPRSCLGWAFESPEHGRGEGHAGFPGFLDLTGVESAGAAARLRFTAWSGAERYGLVPGAAYELLLDPRNEPIDVFALLPSARRV